MTKTIEIKGTTYPEESYGRWAGKPEGNKFNPKHCAYEVWGQWTSYQCSRYCGHGPEGLFCKQHAKKFE